MTAPEFRVSRNGAGCCLWWLAHEHIPADHTGIRPATDAEAALMRRLLASRHPSVVQGDRLGRLMDAAQPDLLAERVP